MISGSVMFDQKLRPNLEALGFSIRRSGKGVYHLNREEDNKIEMYTYNSNSDVLKDIKTGTSWKWGVFKLLFLAETIKIDLFKRANVHHEDTRKVIFDAVIRPYLEGSKDIWFDTYLQGLIVHGYGFAFVFYPSTGKAVDETTTMLGILKLF